MGQAGCAASARDYCRTVLVRYSTYTVAPAAWIRASFDRAEVPDCDEMDISTGNVNIDVHQVKSRLFVDKACHARGDWTAMEDAGSLQGQGRSRSTQQLRNGPGLGVKVIRVWRSLLPLAGNVKVRHEPGKLETSIDRRDMSSNWDLGLEPAPGGWYLSGSLQAPFRFSSAIALCSPERRGAETQRSWQPSRRTVAARDKTWRCAAGRWLGLLAAAQPPSCANAGCPLPVAVCRSRINEQRTR